MKFLKVIKEKLDIGFSKSVVSMSEHDVNMLAIMCKYCRCNVVKHGHLTRSFYAYYISQDEADMEIAKKIFAKYGIHMEIHETRMLGSDKQKALRINYLFTLDPVAVKNEIKKVERKHSALYKVENQQEKMNLQKQLMEFKQRQR